MVAYMNRLTTHINDGRRNSAGVCIANLAWLEPVRPGHTLTFTYEITEKKTQTYTQQVEHYPQPQ